MEKYELIAPCHFGLEAVLKREILDLGYEIVDVSDGKVTFEADGEGVAYANTFLRTTERILLKTALWMLYIWKTKAVMVQITSLQFRLIRI